MIHARAQLFRQLQNFFDLELMGVAPWSSVEPLPAEPVEAVQGRSRFPFGKEREIVSIRFGAFDLTVMSSHEAPPLGSISISGPHGSIEERSLDRDAWRRIGQFVKSHQQRIASHV